MAAAPAIIVTRFPYEEPYHTQINVAASNGTYSGVLGFYCGVDDLVEVGQALGRFPTKVPDEWQYEYGSEDPADRAYCYFLLRAYTTDRAGHCALQFIMNLNNSEPHEGRCTLSIEIEEAQALHRLGELFTKLSGAPNGRFEWSPKSETFTENA